MLVQAKPAYASKEKKACVYCHLSPVGGLRGFRGIYYQRNRHSFAKFVEAVEARRAGVAPNAVGKASKPTKPYADNEE